MGFIGGRLAQFLSPRPGVEILLGSRRNAPRPLWLPGATVMPMDWKSAESLERACDRVDAVVHLARMNAQDCTADPVEALDLNGVGTARLLQAAVRQGVARFIHLSSAHVYGSPLAGTITEKTNANALHPYATSLRAGEDVVRAARQRREIAGTVIRLSNGYGAPAHKDANCWKLLMNDLCRQAVTTGRMALESSGVQRRNFVPMTDVCRAIDHVLHPAVGDTLADVVNVGGEWSPTVWEAACFVRDRCAAILAVTPQLTRVPPVAGEATADLDFRFDLLRQSGYQPGADPAGEIDRLIDFCRASFGGAR